MLRPLQRTVVLVALLVLSGAAAMAQNAPRHVDRERLMRDVATLASPEFEGRAAGSPGGVRARQWIAAQFEEAGLTPAGTDGWFQPFDSGTANVLGYIAGRSPSARTIVITAHYDHDGIRDGVLYPGADDNASGVAALLALAREFAARPPRHPMLFAALDAEEDGLRGARALLAANFIPPPRMALNVNLDMVSRSASHEIFAAGTYHSPWLRPILEDVQNRSAVTIRFGHDRPPGDSDGLEDWTRSSDHGVFHNNGVPFVYFGVEDHDDYHRPTDTAERIDPDFFGDVADMLVEAVRAFDARIG